MVSRARPKSFHHMMLWHESVSVPAFQSSHAYSRPTQSIPPNEVAMTVRQAVPVCVVMVAMLSACSDKSTPLSPHESSGSPAVSATITQPGSADVSDGHGTAWRQVTETVGLTWNQLAQICPQDGIRPCAGSAAGKDLTGWVWATDSQAVSLIATYEPAIRGSRLLQGPAYDAGEIGRAHV